MRRFKSSLKLGLGARFVYSAGRLLLFGVIHALRWSSKIEVRGWENIELARRDGRPLLYAFWHGGVAPIMLLRCHVQLEPMVTLISRSHDGDVAAELTRAFGGEAARGSSSRGGAAGGLHFLSYFGQSGPGGAPWSGVHVMDGPRGPHRKIKPGLVLLARRSNALIVPIVVGLARRWVARSWDRHRVPLPFGRCVFSFGNPIDVCGEREEEVTTESIERAFAELEAEHPLTARDAAIQ